MIILKLIGFYLLVGAFVNLYVFFAEQAALKQTLREQVERQAWEEVGQTGWKLMQISFEFDWMSFVFGTLLWPLVVLLVFTRR
jgi:hypothetical protein